jgi:hypothetical protein
VFGLDKESFLGRFVRFSFGSCFFRQTKQKKRTWNVFRFKSGFGPTLKGDKGKWVPEVLIAARNEWRSKEKVIKTAK